LSAERGENRDDKEKGEREGASGREGASEREGASGRTPRERGQRAGADLDISPKGRL